MDSESLERWGLGDFSKWTGKQRMLFLPRELANGICILGGVYTYMYLYFVKVQSNKEILFQTKHSSCSTNNRSWNKFNLVFLYSYADSIQVTILIFSVQWLMPGTSLAKKNTRPQFLKSEELWSILYVWSQHQEVTPCLLGQVIFLSKDQTNNLERFCTTTRTLTLSVCHGNPSVHHRHALGTYLRNIKPALLRLYPAICRDGIKPWNLLLNCLHILILPSHWKCQEQFHTVRQPYTSFVGGKKC